MSTLLLSVLRFLGNLFVLWHYRHPSFLSPLVHPEGAPNCSWSSSWATLTTDQANGSVTCRPWNPFQLSHCLSRCSCFVFWFFFSFQFLVPPALFVAFHVTGSLPPAPIYFMVNFGVFASTNEKFSNEPHTDFVSCRMRHNCTCIVSCCQLAQWLWYWLWRWLQRKVPCKFSTPSSFPVFNLIQSSIHKTYHLGLYMRY